MTLKIMDKQIAQLEEFIEEWKRRNKDRVLLKPSPLITRINKIIKRKKAQQKQRYEHNQTKSGEDV